MNSKITKQQFSDADKIEINSDEKSLPQEMQIQFKNIDEIDCFKFVEGIDTESCAYKYYNSLNQFRYIYQVSKFRLKSNFIYFSRKSK